jgi:hypothetical protein
MEKDLAKLGLRYKFDIFPSFIKPQSPSFEIRLTSPRDCNTINIVSFEGYATFMKKITVR